MPTITTTTTTTTIAIMKGGSKDTEVGRSVGLLVNTYQHKHLHILVDTQSFCEYVGIAVVSSQSVLCVRVLTAPKSVKRR